MNFCDEKTESHHFVHQFYSYLPGETVIEQTIAVFRCSFCDRTHLNCWSVGGVSRLLEVHG